MGWAKEQAVYLSLDLKTRFSSEGSLTQAVLKQLARTGMKDNVMLLFLDHNELVHSKRACPEVAVRALVRARLHNYVGYLQAIGADCVNIAYDLFRPGDIDQLHAAGISVALGGLWNPEATGIAHLDIDILSYDDPTKARELLGIS